MTKKEIAGYMIQDADGRAIFGIGATEDEAWAGVVDGCAPFFDSNGKEMDEETARQKNFKTYPATQELIEHVRRYGGDTVWDIVDGVAGLPIEG